MGTKFSGSNTARSRVIHPLNNSASLNFFRCFLLINHFLYFLKPVLHPVCPKNINLTPVAGLIFETKIESFFLESFFLESFFLEQHYCPRTLFPSMSVEWIHFPRIRTFAQKRFHGLFSKKKRSKSGGVPSFPRREHVLAVIPLPSGQRSALDSISRDYLIT